MKKVRKYIRDLDHKMAVRSSHRIGDNTDYGYSHTPNIKRKEEIEGDGK